jgi:hypothetical protein
MWHAAWLTAMRTGTTTDAVGGPVRLVPASQALMVT